MTDWRGEGDPEVQGGETSTHNGRRGWIIVAGDEAPFEYAYRCEVCDYEGEDRITEEGAKNDGAAHESRRVRARQGPDQRVPSETPVEKDWSQMSGSERSALVRRTLTEHWDDEPSALGPIEGESLKSLSRTFEIENLSYTLTELQALNMPEASDAETAEMVDQINVAAARGEDFGEREELLSEIDAAVADFRTVYPEPALLAPNLDLAVRAAELIKGPIKVWALMYQENPDYHDGTGPDLVELFATFWLAQAALDSHAGDAKFSHYHIEDFEVTQ